MKLADVPAPVWQLATSVIGGLLVLYLWNRYSEKLGNAINPLNHDNVWSASVNAAGEAITGTPYSLGAGFFNLFHEDEFERSEREHRERLAAQGG